MAIIDKIEAIADAIREKSGSTDMFCPDSGEENSMFRAIMELPPSDGTYPGTYYNIFTGTPYPLNADLILIGNAVRDRTGRTDKMTLAEMANAIRSIRNSNLPNSLDRFKWEYGYGSGIIYRLIGVGNYGATTLILPTTYRGKSFISGFDCTIVPGAFMGDNIITTVIFQEGWQSIPGGYSDVGLPTYYGAFGGHSSLRTVHFPSSLKKITAHGFKDSGLTEVIFPEHLTELKIEERAFAGCNNLERVIIPGDYPITINEYAFASCPNLNDIYVSWDEGEVAGAPWGATNATVHYNYTA